MADAVSQVQSHSCTDTSTISDTLVGSVLMELNAPHFTSIGTLKMWLRSSLRAVLKKMRSYCQEVKQLKGMEWETGRVPESMVTTQTLSRAAGLLVWHCFPTVPHFLAPGLPAVLLCFLPLWQEVTTRVGGNMVFSVNCPKIGILCRLSQLRRVQGWMKLRLPLVFSLDSEDTTKTISQCLKQISENGKPSLRKGC